MELIILVLYRDTLRFATQLYALIILYLRCLGLLSLSKIETSKFAFIALKCVILLHRDTDVIRKTGM